jgi:hypothetical protein
MGLLRGTVRLAQRQHCQKVSNPRPRETVPALILIQRSHYCTLLGQNLRPGCAQTALSLSFTHRARRMRTEARPGWPNEAVQPRITSRTARYVLVACILGGVPAGLSDPCGSR